MSVRRAEAQGSFLLLSPRRLRELSGIFKRQNSSKSRSDSGHGWLPGDNSDSSNKEDMLMRTFSELGVDNFFRPTTTVVYEADSGLALSLPRSTPTRTSSRSPSKRPPLYITTSKNDAQQADANRSTSAASRMHLLNRLVEDLLQHETDYLKSLAILHEGFELPLQSKFCPATRCSRLRKLVLRMSGKKARKTVGLAVSMLFRHVSQLIAIHSRLQTELLAIKSMAKRFGDNADVYAVNCMTVFLGKCITDMSIYGELVKQQVDALCAFENLRYTDGKLAAEVARCEEMTGYNLRSLMQEVRQSIWFYIGLVERFGNICSPSEYGNIRTHLEYLKGIYRNIGPYLRQIDMLCDLAKLQSRIVGLDSPLVRRNIEILYEGQFQYQSGKQTMTSRVHCWLFTDQIVIARYAHDNTLVHEATFSLDQTHLVDSPSSSPSIMQPQLLCLTTHGHKQIAYLHGDSDEQLTVWRNAIQYAMRTTAARAKKKRSLDS
ncbi:hypothetical protein SYNPS1DRAFT_28696 [Syncephalis pseudoplumigaleata]|uniref:DH domain-containing protein n=1 Tax=Syncephalis pseudoplumigaleata TaxID=1712513 RepID=A0A4P9Z0Z1_9FUNG|nr:hypothetical protein SYNPS1DRAFT_28696 [Syncephalis pseudoplumigaleata]|eukprot:RKP25572.1 hypothetical protein SYNPS1DRAFT_28696 [Syncephalis pseudoplumigaleata]